jgi:hypothetical protein
MLALFNDAITYCNYVTSRIGEWMLRSIDVLIMVAVEGALPKKAYQ